MKEGRLKAGLEQDGHVFAYKVPAKRGGLWEALAGAWIYGASLKTRDDRFAIFAFTTNKKPIRGSTSDVKIWDEPVPIIIEKFWIIQEVNLRLKRIRERRKKRTG